MQQLGLPPIPRVPPQRMAAAAAEGGPARPGGPLVPPGGGSMLWETRSTPPLWSIGEHRVDGGPGQHMRLALSAGTDEFLLGGALPSPAAGSYGWKGDEWKLEHSECLDAGLVGPLAPHKTDSIGDVHKR